MASAGAMTDNGNITEYEGASRLGASTGNSDSGLAPEDYASIALAVVLLLLIIAIIVGFILFKKGYFGQRVSPSAEDQEEKPKLISYFSRSGTSLYSESIEMKDNFTPRHEYKPGPETNPIIYLYDDIYYPPNIRPSAEKRAKEDEFKFSTRKTHEPPNKRITAKPPYSRSVPKPTNELLINSKYKSEAVKRIQEEVDEDIVVIPDTGIHSYTRYGYCDPYSDWEPAFVIDY